MKKLILTLSIIICGHSVLADGGPDSHYEEYLQNKKKGKSWAGQWEGDDPPTNRSPVYLQRLLNGGDLTQFETLGNANWQANEGVVEADEGSGFLVSKETFTSFVLSLEFFAEDNTNSGVFIRCSDPANINDETCLEINIFDQRPDQTYRTGAVVNVAPPSAHVTTEGRWNQLVINVQWKRISVILNGQETVNVRLDQEIVSGPIALQLAQGGIKFRNIEVGRVHTGHGQVTPAEHLEGVWELSRFDLAYSDGSVEPWCEGAYGSIIYTNGFMSVSINCTSNPEKKLFYSGPYHLKQDLVVHEVQNYSDESLNQTFERRVILPECEYLVLTGPLPGGGEARVSWQRRN